MLRRVLFVAIPVVFYRFPGFQLMLLLLVSTAYLMVYASNRPHESLLRVKLELFNECMIMLLNYHMLLFSNFSSSEDFSYAMGYSLVFFAAATIFTNLYLMIRKTMDLVQTRNLVIEKKESRRKYLVSQQGEVLKKKIEEKREESLMMLGELPPEETPTKTKRGLRLGRQGTSVMK
jgi:hypothetical protein